MLWLPAGGSDLISSALARSPLLVPGDQAGPLVLPRAGRSHSEVTQGQSLLPWLQQAHV